MKAVAWERDGREIRSDKIMVSKWESGVKSPSTYYRVLLCLVFEMPAEALGFLEPEEETAAWRATRHLPTTSETRGSQALINLAKALPVHPILPGGREETPDLLPLLGDPRDDLPGITAGLRRLDGLLGPGLVIDHAVAQQNLVISLLDKARGAAARGRLAGEAADITGLIAWMTFDVAEFDPSLALYRTAASLALEARRHDLLAWVLGSEALVLAHLGDDRRAVDVLRRAEAIAMEAGEARTRGWLATIASQACARLGDGQAAWRAYRDAERLLDQTTGGECSSWLAFLDHAHLSCAAGRIYLGLGQSRNARRELERALAHHPPRLVRERGQFLAHLAEAALATNDLDAACGLLGDAFVIASRTRSQRVAGRIARLRATIPPRRQTAAAVRNLDQRIRRTRTEYPP
jgi:tetratricopeptide (TPR) repeat protein